MKSSRRVKENGASLIVTLLVIVLIATIITGFVTATRIEQQASRNFTYQNIAEQMAHQGIRHAIAQLNSAGFNSPQLITQPGRAFTNQTPTPLSSSSLPNASATMFNLNEGQVFHTNNGTNFFTAAFVPSLATNSATVTTNGRFAYWIDDDGSKANLNAMSVNQRPSYFPTNSRPFSAASFGTSVAEGFSNVFANTNATTPWSYFFSPQQIVTFQGVGTNNVKPLAYEIAGSDLNLTNLIPALTNNSINLTANLSTATSGQVRFPRNFLTNASGAENLTSEIDNLIETRIDRPDITNRFGSGFADKYTQEVLRQIVVNINDYNLATGTTANPGLTATTGGGNLDSEGIPSEYSGLKRFIHLNEIATQVAYSTDTLTLGSMAEVQIWFKVELVNPYSIAWGDAAQILFKIDNFSATATYTTSTGGGTSTLSEPTPQDASTAGGGTPIGINLFNNVPANSYAISIQGNDLTFGFEYQFYSGNGTSNIPSDATNIQITSVSFRPVFVKLLQWANASNTIRDWATATDFSAVGQANGVLRFSGNIPRVTSSLKKADLTTAHLERPAANIANFNGAGVLGIAKNDPRVRSFQAWSINPQAWSGVGANQGRALTLGGPNVGTINFTAGTGLANIPSDSVGGIGNDIFAHPSLQNGFRAQNANETYQTLMELGNVHTGLQWRTLQIKSQSTAESAARHIPDWALLNSFYIGTNRIPKLNLNSVVYPAASSSSMNASAQLTAGLLRPRAVASLLNAGANSTLATSANYTSTSTIPAGSVTNISRSISQMGFLNSWAARRTSLGDSRFPSNAYAMIGEVLEIPDVSNFNATNDFINEGRAASFIDAVSVFSDSFTVHSVGQAIDKTGANVSEYRLRATVRRDGATGRYRVTLLQPVPPL